MTKTPILAAVYLRVSLDRTGEHLAVERQREDCRAIASQRGWTVVEEYVDNSISASDARTNRPAYDRMVIDHDRGRFSALICWDLDRLTRQPRQLEDWIDAAEQSGLKLVTANGEADLTTDGGRMYARIKAAVARGEVERKGARQARAQRQRAEKGKPPAGVRLTGYTIKGELIPDEAATIREVFARFAAGDSLRSIARWLEDSGVPTRRGGRWNPSTVNGILTNARYAGRSTFKGEDIQHEGAWQAIVSPAQFATVQAILADPRRKTNHRGTDAKYLGSSLYVCGECGEKVYSWSGYRYRCKAGCLGRSGAHVDGYVIGVVRERLGRPDLAELLPRPVDDSRLKEAAEKVNEAQRRLKRIEADYDAGYIDGRRYAAATEKARAEIVAADREQVRALAGSGLASVIGADDPVAAFDDAPLMIRQKVIDSLMTITLMRGTRGSRTFDPDTVVIDWRAS